MVFIADIFNLKERNCPRMMNIAKMAISLNLIKELSSNFILNLSRYKVFEKGILIRIRPCLW